MKLASVRLAVQMNRLAQTVSSGKQSIQSQASRAKAEVVRGAQVVKQAAQKNPVFTAAIVALGLGAVGVALYRFNPAVASHVNQVFGGLNNVVNPKAEVTKADRVEPTSTALVVVPGQTTTTTIKISSFFTTIKLPSFFNRSIQDLVVNQPKLQPNLLLAPSVSSLVAAAPVRNSSVASLVNNSCALDNERVCILENGVCRRL